MTGAAVVLADGLRGFGLFAGGLAAERILRHLALVQEWNEKVNLTAVTDMPAMVIKHAVDSATVQLVAPLRPGMRVADVGTGAGFPGVTLKCLEPGVDLVLVESLAKRCRFLEEVGREVLGVRGEGEGFSVVWSRAEDVGNKPEFRETCDLVVARAVADLRILAELCLPLCRVGGSFVAMKGPGVDAELSQSVRAIGMVGGEVAEVRGLSLPDAAGERTLVRINKVRATPRAYPRRAGTPAKSPL